jgi:hypothetical protein
MATFPSLVPSGRTFTPGEYPHTPFSTVSGFQGRVRHSNVMLASQVRLTFTAVVEANMLSILSHYQGQLGTYESFDLPAAVWSGVTAADYQLSGYLWRYTAPPTVEDVYCGRYTIELALETVPPDGAIVDGMWRIVRTSLLPRGAAASNGLSLTITASITATGPEFGATNFSVITTLGAASGWTGTTAITLEPGLPGVEGDAPGSASTVTLSLVGGSVTVTPESDYWSDMSAQLYSWESLAYIEWWGN